MKRSEINHSIRLARAFFAANYFYLPTWAALTPNAWAACGAEYDEIRDNALGWDVTDFGKGNFAQEGLTLFTLRNGNPAKDRKPYCEKIMLVRNGQITPIHFHWHKMEDIINRGGGELCMKLWKANAEERMTDDLCTVQVDGVSVIVPAGAVFRLKPGQSICYEPYMYHTFWAEGGDCLVGEVSTVNDDACDNRFYESMGRYPQIEEDESAEYLLCNEYTK